MLHIAPRAFRARRLLAVSAVLAAACCAFGQAGETQVQFVVSAPDKPAAEKLFVSLSTDSWPEGGRELSRVAERLYAATIKLPSGTNVEYKFLREQSWQTVEKTVNGDELGNRVLMAPEGAAELVVFHNVARWADEPTGKSRDAVFSIPAAQAGAGETRITGRLETLEKVAAPQLGNERRVFVLLPEDYERNAAARYPVLYMHDGQNLFDAKASTAGAEWGIDEAAARLVQAGQMRPAIIVAVANTPERMKEYSPFPDRNFGGDADKYLAFIVDTLKPQIDKRYRTLTDRENTFIAGSSMGGLVSLYAVVKHPDVFGGAGVISPALFWGNGKMLELLANRELKRPVRIWIDMGTNEGARESAESKVTRAVTDARKLAALLKEKGLAEGQDFMYLEVKDGVHHESAWAARADRFLAFLLPPQPPRPAN